MLMALETGAVDFICTDMPTAQGALIAYSDLKILDLPENAFKVDEGDINIGISVKKGNTELKDKINSALAGMTADDFNKIMNEATKIQPLSKELTIIRTEITRYEQACRAVERHSPVLER